MPPRGREVEEALLTWVNGFKGLPHKARTLADLTDGAIFLKILERFDRAYAADIILERVTSSSKWLAKKKNLENVHKSLVRYMNNHCDFPPFALEDPVDFNAIAEHNDVDETMKLLSIFLMAAITSPENAQYILEIQAMNESVASQIATVIQAMEGEKEQSKLTNSDEPRLSPKVSSNIDLAIEEEFAKLTKQHETLIKKHADERTKNDRLQMNNEELLADIRAKDREIEQFNGSNNEADTNYISNLKIRLQEQESIIDTLERQVEDNRIVKEKQAKELSALRPLVSQVQELQDENRELQASNGSLTKKANKVDHYEKKLQGQANLQKEFDRLRATNSTLESNMVTFDKVHQNNNKLLTEIETYRQRMQEYEIDLHDHITRRDRLESELRTKDAQLELLKEQKAHDDQFIDQLQEGIKTNEIHQPPDSPSAVTGHLNLESELEQSEAHHVNYPLEISRLKAEIQTLRDNAAGTSTPTLRADREQLQAVVKRLQTQNQELMEKHAIGQEQLNALLSEHSGEKNEAISNTRKLWLDATKDLSTSRAKLAELQLRLTDSDRQLLAATAELNALDKEELDALEELKSANATITASLQNDLLSLQGEHNSLRTDFEQQKSQLVEALLSKDKTLADLAKLRDVANANDQVLYEKNQAEKRLKEEKTLSDMNELKQQQKLTSLQEINKQELVIQDLKQKLKLAAESSPDAQKAKHEAIIKNLMRENALITTAWYDLSSRLQSNNVVLQRRQDAPKSWLNRQRQMINATPRR